jgi:hypothetical protein
MVSFLEKLIEADCGERRRPLSQVAEPRWILLANIFQRMEFRLARSWRDGRLSHPTKYFSDFCIS